MKMGYYTHHKLNFEGKELEENILEELENIVDEYTFNAININDKTDSEEIKWYSHEEDIRKLSLKFPNVLFKVEGEGEENNDLWVEYYKNGKRQRCEAKITFDEYDENQLK